MDLAPVAAHLLAVLTAGVEIGDLAGSEHVVHILGQLGLQRSHHGELLSNKNLGEQVVSSCEHHSLLLEVLNMCTLGEELGHVAYLVTGLAREHITGAGQDGGAHEHGYIGQVGDELLHQRQVLRTIVLGWHVDLQERDIDIAQVIVVTLLRVADEKFALRVVMLQSIFQGSAHEAASDNSNVNHLFVNILNCYCLFRFCHTESTENTEIVFFKVRCSLVLHKSLSRLSHTTAILKQQL